MAAKHTGIKVLRAQTAFSFRIKHVAAYEQDGQHAWVVKLSVGRGNYEVDGWVFIDSITTELRFDLYDTMEPPGFLSGRYLQQDKSTSSLGLLFDRPTEENLSDTEDAIKQFMDRCLFCVRSVTDMATGIMHTTAIAYRYNKTSIPIPSASALHRPATVGN